MQEKLSFTELGMFLQVLHLFQFSIISCRVHFTVSKRFFSFFFMIRKGEKRIRSGLSSICSSRNKTNSVLLLLFLVYSWLYPDGAQFYRAVINTWFLFSLSLIH